MAIKGFIQFLPYPLTSQQASVFVFDERVGEEIMQERFNNKYRIAFGVSVFFIGLILYWFNWQRC
jgi:hypothetical protein